MHTVLCCVAQPPLCCMGHAQSRAAGHTTRTCTCTGLQRIGAFQELSSTHVTLGAACPTVSSYSGSPTPLVLQSFLLSLPPQPPLLPRRALFRWAAPPVHRAPPLLVVRRRKQPSARGAAARVHLQASLQPHAFWFSLPACLAHRWCSGCSTVLPPPQPAAAVAIATPPPQQTQPQQPQLVFANLRMGCRHGQGGPGSPGHGIGRGLLGPLCSDFHFCAPALCL